MFKISWGRKMGYAWGLSSGLIVAAAVAFDQWWMSVLAILPFVGMVICRDNDVARNGGVAYKMED